MEEKKNSDFGVLFYMGFAKYWFPKALPLVVLRGVRGENRNSPEGFCYFCPYKSRERF